MVSNLILKDAGHVTYGDNNQGKIKGFGSIVQNNKVIIDQVLLVKGLKHNLISVSQLCDKGKKVTFLQEHCMIADSKTNKLLFT